MSTISKNDEQAIKVMLDDMTFMLFDLERGNHILSEDNVRISDNMSFTYKRNLIEETIDERGWKNITSDFYISGYKDDVQVLKFETRGKLRKFTLYQFDGFLANMLMNELERFRKKKFNIP